MGILFTILQIQKKIYSTKDTQLHFDPVMSDGLLAANKLYITDIKLSSDLHMQDQLKTH